MRHRSIRAVLAGLAASGMVVGIAASPAQAAGAPLIQGLAGPLSISVDHGKIYVAQSFGGKLSRFGTDGSGGKTLYQRSPKVEVAAVQAKGPGVLFAVTGKNEDGKFAKLKHRATDGTVTTRADLRGFEKRFNPDGHVTYNFRDISDSCAAKVPEEVGGASYTGVVDSHPYATAMMADGTAVVADAAGNDIITVSPSGFRTEIATLPAQPVKVTKALAHQFGMPGCVVGHRFWFEPVPTDVEIHDGMLYVSVLPGGPEDPSLGARGKVYTVDPSNGDTRLIGKGFLSATDLAVSPKGKVYVTELFGGQVSTIKDGVAKKVKAFEQPTAIEWYRGRLYVAGGLEGPGWVDRFRP
jgi:hypothetical protein